MCITLTALIAGSLARPATAGDDAEAAVAAAVDDAVARYRLPGIAVGVLRADGTRQLEVRGETVLGSGDAVTPDTLFAVASNTKAMTAALLARLVDQGRLRWRDPVVAHLPDFRMHDDWVSREIQVRDLLIHNSGLGAGAGDLMLWPAPNHFSRAEVIHGLRYLRPVSSFRSEYAYDNTLYIVAGEVAAAAGGAPYDALLRREVFAPLGMQGCRIGEWSRDAGGSVARRHLRRGDGFVAADVDPPVVADMPMAAAGGVRCSLDAMLRWAAAWLHPEHVGVDAQGQPWLSTTQRDAVWTAHTPMPLSARMRRWDGSHFSAYGYGWRLTDVDGTRKVSHTGTLSGMYSALTLLPDHGTGLVVLINADADEARTVLMQALVKQVTAPQAALTVTAIADMLAAERTKAATGQGAAAHARVPELVPVDASELPGDAGRYRDPWFGDVAICPQPDGALRFVSAKSPRLAGAVMRSGQRLLVRWDDAGIETDAWLLWPAADAAAGAPLRMAKVDPDADFSYDFEDLAFVRIGDCARP